MSEPSTINAVEFSVLGCAETIAVQLRVFYIMLYCIVMLYYIILLYYYIMYYLL